METPRHGNGSKISGNPSKVGFLRCFRDFFKFFGNPSKFQFWGVSSFLIDLPELYIHFRFISFKYFRGISQYFRGISQYFWGDSQYFLNVSSIFGPFPLFQKLLDWYVSSYFLSVSSNFIGPFPNIFDPFPLFSKTFLLQILKCSRYHPVDTKKRWFKSFWIRANGSKIWGNEPKIWGNRSTKWDF